MNLIKLKKEQLKVLLVALITSCSLMASQGSIYAQENEITVSGNIKDDTGEPVIGATVVVQGTTVGTITDVDGNYTLGNVPSNSTLIFSFIGFETQTVVVEGKTSISVTLGAESIGLDEVVAIGYGTIKKGDLTGAVAKIDTKSIEQRPITRADQALAGAMAGVAVRTTTGEPGAALQIRVRGTASVSADNDPLYVIDGVVMDDINDINPNDIASIEVLKDAASTAIYGSRGANGVVLVTTKSGVKGKPKFNFSAYYGLQHAEKKLDLLSGSEWIDMATELIDKRWASKYGGSADDTYLERAAILGVNNPEDYYNANVTYMKDPRWGTDELAYIDWQDEFYRTAPISNYQLSVSGGSDNTKYNISGAWFDQEGIATETGYKRINLNSKLNCKLSDRVTVDLKLSPAFSWKYGPSIDGKDGISHKMLATNPVVEKDAGLYTNFGYNRRYRWAGSSVSPIGIMESVTDNLNRMSLNSALNFNINLLKGLDFKVNSAWYFQSYDHKNYTPTYNLVDYSAGEKSSSYKDTRRYNNYQLETLLNYNIEINDHNFTVMGGWSMEDKNYDRQYIRLADFPNDDVTTINYTSANTIKDSYTQETESTYLSYFARLMYSYQSKYLFSGSIRRDGSSKFGSDNYWAAFPAFSLGWRISQEGFMQSLSAINNLKLRVSWGINGNNSVDDYTTAASMSTVNYSFNDVSTVGYYTSSMANNELSWEQTSSTDIGLDLGLFANRIVFTADYYYKKTTDLLFKEPLPTVSGFSTSLQNVGSVENKGIEFELTSHILTGKLKWDFSGNIGFNKNKVLQLGPNQDYIMSGWGNKTNIISLNHALNSFYLYEAIGVLSEADINDDSVAKTANAIAGDVKYKDYDLDGDIDSDDIHRVGKPNPDFTYGITNNFTYKNFNLSFFLQGQQGCKAYALLGRAIDRTSMGTSSNALGRWRNRYRSEDQPGDGHTPRIDGTTGGLLDTRWLYDASYIRLKNVTLTYNVPNKLIKGISNCRVYASIENLWKHDNYYGGFSPESANTSGTDYGAYPEAKTYTIGVNISF